LNSLLVVSSGRTKVMVDSPLASGTARSADNCQRGLSARERRPIVMRCERGCDELRAWNWKTRSRTLTSDSSCQLRKNAVKLARVRSSGAHQSCVGFGRRQQTR